MIKLNLLHSLYRISDKGNPKSKLEFADKMYCLQNFISVFGKEQLIVFADNCEPATLENLKTLGIDPIVTKLGNALSFQHMIDYALKNFAADSYLYLIEDDYLHLPGSNALILEGLAIADYVTLYDHPDKYISFNEGGYNHHILAEGEETKVFLTRSSHWKITNSSTMTFACSLKTLKSDYSIWSFYKTHDYLAFQKIAGYPLKLKDDIQVLKNKVKGINLFKNTRFYLQTIYHHFKNKLYSSKKTLIVCLPGKATHVEVTLLAPLTDWTKI